MEKRIFKANQLTGRVFDALPALEKERIFQELEREMSEQRRAQWKKPSATERAKLLRIKKKMGRPKIGKGCKVVAVSVEIDLLEQADAYAKRLGLGRTELFTLALRGFLPARNAS